MVFLSSLALGQPVLSPRSFEVASVKPHPGPLINMEITTSGPRFNAEAQTLFALVMYAYNLKNYQISEAPQFPTFGRDYYDIVAKAEGDVAPTKDEFRQMLQALLADRFKLIVHREMHDVPVYGLAIGKNGPRFKESIVDGAPMGHVSVIGRNYQVTMPKANMDDVVVAIANSRLDRPVMDMTGLKGTYDIKLTYTLDTKSSGSTDPDLSDISIFIAVQNQLGLKLKPQKAMLPILLVDHLEKPSAN